MCTFIFSCELSLSLSLSFSLSLFSLFFLFYLFFTLTSARSCVRRDKKTLIPWSMESKKLNDFFPFLSFFSSRPQNLQTSPE